ncbi:MAG: FHA domain-containing protein [Candidatus Brocadiae bacterium]|nr:FHA domain-containing protein [Candidatus Brocadiia bacterium]
MSFYNDEEFLEAALEQKFITPQEMQKARKLREESPSHHEMGEILLLNNIIGEKQYNVIKTLLRYKSKKMKRQDLIAQRNTEEQEADKEFAKKALKEGLIDSENLSECIAHQKKMLSQGQNLSLMEVMLSKNYITHDDIQYIEAGDGLYTEDWMEFLRKANEKTEESDSNIIFDEKLIKTAPRLDPLKKADTTKKIKGKEKLNKLPLIMQVISGDDSGRFFTLVQKENFIGRVKESEVYLQDTRVSRTHCKIHHIEGQGWEIIDMESTYGVFVNGNKIEKVFLQKHDKIQIGKTIIEIQSL